MYFSLDQIAPVLTVIGLLLSVGIVAAMTLETLNQDQIERNPEIADPSLFEILRELQGLKFTVVQGAAVDTNIAVTDIETEDTLVAVLRVVGARAATPDVTDVTNVTSEASITSSGNMQLTTTATSDDALVVIWFDKQ